MAKKLNILMTCVGRRVGLMEAFRRSMKALRVQGQILGADWSPLAPGLAMADERFLVPGVNSPDYIDVILDICRRREVGMVIPLLDWELQPLADARERFAEADVRVIVSSPRVIGICRDKRKTFEFLSSRGVGTPRILEFGDAMKGKFPVMVKDRYGSSARNVMRATSPQTLKRAFKGDDKMFIQEVITGPEYTVDVYAGLDGIPRVAVPRERLQVRAGEVCKARTVRHENIITEALRVVALLQECVGVITVQCRVASDGTVNFFDLNARFGGGVPLAIRAGADFPRWIIQEHFGQRPDINSQEWEDGLLMLRYDAEVFLKESELPQDKWILEK
jgi:carbamoyl-phosphate synthase large subunit